MFIEWNASLKVLLSCILIGLFRYGVFLIFEAPEKIDFDVVPFKTFENISSNIPEEMKHDGNIQKNFVFIKCMKCGTETMATVLRRFVIEHNLNFAIPRMKNIHHGWPFLICPSDIRNSSRPIEGLIEHSIFNYTTMSELFPAGTVFISIIRYPWTQFLSTFNYFRMQRRLGMKSDNPVTKYLHNIEKYERLFKKHNFRSKCIPPGYSLTKNPMSHCLGMPIGFPHFRLNITSDMHKVHAYIDELDQEFFLIMLVEYYHESLVLLKRIMHWTLKDMIYFRRNIGKYKKATRKGGNFRIHKQWASLDYLLYDHFNKTFWKKVEQQTEDFSEEVSHFTIIQRRSDKFCDFITRQPESDKHHLHIPRSKFNNDFYLNQDDCSLIRYHYLLYKMKEIFDEREPVHDTDDGHIRGC